MVKNIICLFIILLLASLMVAGCSCVSSTYTNNHPESTSRTPVVPTEYHTDRPLLTPSVSATIDVTSTIMDIYRNNGNCSLPCWWGVVPGETSWQTVPEKFEGLAEIKGPYKYTGVDGYDLNFVLPEDIDPFGNLNIQGVSPGSGAVIWVENGIVKAISVNSYFVTPDFDYSLSGLLTIFGKPDDIWLAASAEIPEPGGHPTYELRLFYPELGIMVSILGYAEMHDDELEICPQNLFYGSNYPPSLLLWSSNTTYEFQGIMTDLLPGVNLGSPERYHLIETWNDTINSDSFFYMYTHPNSSCFSVHEWR